MVSHSAEITYLYWCSPKSERVRRLFEGPQASSVYLSFKNIHEDGVCGDWVERCIKVKTEGLGGLHSPSWGRFTVVSVRSQRQTAKN